MNYMLIHELVNLVEQFHIANKNARFPDDLDGFKQWIAEEMMADKPHDTDTEPEWDGKQQGRSPESVISTLLVHMNRYGRMYSRSVIHDSDFSTQEEFIYLITLKSYGEMTKMDLIRKNIQDKPTGMLIINRLIMQGWVRQVNSSIDKRSKLLQLTPAGADALFEIKEKIDKATRLVSGNLTRTEQLDLIRLLQKLERFHHPIYSGNTDKADLLDRFPDFIRN